ncbi:MAG: PaaI family thioesterase [Deltaproteobacteria bacterium]|nr:PaaI family thioesterase [Deltaproteobacteria bacterium]
MEKNNDPKHLPNRETHNCFGCSPINASGLQMKFSTDESTVFSRLTVPDHLCGWDRLVHGGVISTILDEIMSWTGIYMLKQITMTKSMTVDFIKPVYINSELKIEGNVLEKTGRHEVLIEGRLFNDKGTLCARSRGNFVIFSPAVAKRLGIAQKEHLEWFEEIYNI